MIRQRLWNIRFSACSDSRPTVVCVLSANEFGPLKARDAILRQLDQSGKHMTGLDLRFDGNDQENLLQELDAYTSFVNDKNEYFSTLRKLVESTRLFPSSQVSLTVALTDDA